jgi:Ca2+-binding EF-hand superfamily protein
VSKGEKEKLGLMFKNFDKNSDGLLDKNEIQ